MCARPSAPASPAAFSYRETKAETSHAWLPMPDIVAAAVMIRRTQQDGEREAAGEIWQQTNDMQSLVFTGRYGTPIDPGTLNRKFTARLRRWSVRGAGRTARWPWPGPTPASGISTVASPALGGQSDDVLVRGQRVGRRVADGDLDVVPAARAAAERSSRYGGPTRYRRGSRSRGPRDLPTGPDRARYEGPARPGVA